MKQEDQLQTYSEVQAAKLLGISPCSLRTLRKEGAVSYSRLRYRIVYTSRDLLEFLDRNRVVATK
jgi:hypothetical protein